MGNFSDQQNSGSLTINKEDNSKETYNNITRALNNDSWTKEHGVSRDQSKGLHESYRKRREQKQLAGQV